MFNTIILKRGYGIYTESEYKRFNKGDEIWGNDNNPEVLKKWNIDQRKDAIQELEKYRCTYKGGYGSGWEVEEYALEFCECDEDGEFVSGSDFDLAKEA